MVDVERRREDFGRVGQPAKLAPTGRAEADAPQVRRDAVQNDRRRVGDHAAERQRGDPGQTADDV